MTEEATFYCSFCDSKETVSVPTSFVTRYGSQDVEDAMCPEHSGASAFLDDQCPGCVGGWGDCGMFSAIGNEAVSADDLATIRSGRCPHRVNGTMSFGPGGMEKIDLSERSNAGDAFADAVTSSLHR